jgi:hypothetical protein
MYIIEASGAIRQLINLNQESIIMTTSTTNTFIKTAAAKAYEAVKASFEFEGKSEVLAARAGALCREIWSAYDESYTAKKVYDDLKASGFLPIDAVYSYERIQFNADMLADTVAIYDGEAYYFTKGSYLPIDWVESNAKKSKIDVATIKKEFADIITVKADYRCPFYTALVYYNPRKPTRAKAGARTADTKVAAPKVEVKGVTAPAMSVAVATTGDWVNVAKSFMESKPTMSTRRAVLLQLQSIFGCDIEESI